MARYLSRYLGDESKSEKRESDWNHLCRLSSYHALQVCTRYLMSHEQYEEALPRVEQLLQRAPYDPIILSMRIDIELSR